MSFDFEFHAPQFIESWENATTIDDGADNFFDALDSLEDQKKRNLSCKEIERTDSHQERNDLKENRIEKENKPEDRTEENFKNITSTAKNECDTTERRLSLKRKASPLKDRNECVPLLNRLETHKQKFAQVLPTIAESPVLLTKERVRAKPCTAPEERVILKPLRKKNIGVCLKPLPKPPTIPQPFSLTEPGKNVHSCIEDTGKNVCITPHRNSSKKKRMEDSANKYEFRARSPSVLRKEPFRPVLRPRTASGGVAQVSTEDQTKRKENCEQTKKDSFKPKQLVFEEKKMQELEENLFVFKARPAPKSNASFNSMSSSSKRSHADSSVGGEMKQEFKAKEAKVLKKVPFWPEIETRFIQIDSAPSLTTEKRALERKTALEEKKKKQAEEEKELYEEVMKVERELLRALRKKREFKATSIKK